MRHLWTQEKIDYLKTHYPTRPRDEIQKVLGLPWLTIRKKAASLKVRRSLEGSGSFATWKPKVDISPVDLAYIAGFVDGEGCISIHVASIWNTSQLTYYTYVAFDITNTNYEVLEWIRQTVGYPHIKGLSVKSRGKPKSQKPGWELRIRGRRQLSIFIAQLLPYLKVKKTQAELVLKYLQGNMPSRSLEALTLALQVRKANDSWRDSDIKKRERLQEIISQAESRTNSF